MMITKTINLTKLTDAIGGYELPKLSKAIAMQDMGSADWPTTGTGCATGIACGQKSKHKRDRIWIQFYFLNKVIKEE